MGGVLDPQGPIGAAERTDPAQRHGDHAGRGRAGDRADAGLRLVVPRRQHQARAICRTGRIPGRVEMVVWSIPALVVLFLGGIGWIGTPRPRSAPSRSPRDAQPLESRSCRSTGSGCSSTPTQGVASVNRLVVPAGTPLRFRLTSATRDEQLLRAAARQPDLHDGRHDDARCNLQADKPGTYPGLSARSSAATASPTCASTSWRCRRPSSQHWVAQRARRRRHARRRAATPALAPAGHRRRARDLRQRSTPGLFETIADPAAPHRVRGTDMLGKLDLGRHPASTSRSRWSPSAGRASLVLARRRARHLSKGWWPYLWREWITSVDHKRIGVMYVAAGAGDAGARLHRRDDDALAAGARGRRRARATCRPSTTTRSSRPTARS